MRLSVVIAAGVSALAILGVQAVAQAPDQGPAAVQAAPGNPAAAAAAGGGRGGGRGASRGPAAPVEVVRHGDELYQAHCAACHEHATGRIPPRNMIEVSRSPEYIMQVLTIGPMVQQASGLSDDDKKAIAAYLMGRLPSAAGEVNPLANHCSRAPAPLALEGSNWLGWGGVGMSNTRYQPDPGLKAGDVAKLKLKWAFALPGGTSSQASIVGNRILVPTTSGYVIALDRDTGCAFWATNLGSPVRTSPSVAQLPGKKFEVLVADNKGEAVALDADTGKILWRTRVEEHPWVRMTGAPALYQDRVYVPISSYEESAPGLGDYKCCNFRGSVAMLDVASGRMIYKAYTLDEPARPLADGHRTGPAGVAIWSAPTIDPKRQVMYVGTGNSYTDPAPPVADAVIAMDLQTGAKKWVNQVTANDAFGGGCGANAAHPENCPNPQGPDADLGSSPLLVTMPGNKQMVVATSKGGDVIAMDPDNAGHILWQSKQGRILWGGASDGTRIYISATSGGPGAGLYALSPADGSLLWGAAAPKGACGWGAQGCTNDYYSAPMVIPGAVFAGSLDGHVRAYAAEDGHLLWDFDTGHSFNAVDGGSANGGSIDQGGQTIAQGTLLITSGGRNSYPGNALLAFTVDGK